jgi:hypothetical protein
MHPRHTTARDGGSADFAGASLACTLFECTAIRTSRSCASMRPRHTTARDGGSADFAGACPACTLFECSATRTSPSRTSCPSGHKAIHGQKNRPAGAKLRRVNLDKPVVATMFRRTTGFKGQLPAGIDAKDANQRLQSILIKLILAE